VPVPVVDIQTASMDASFRRYFRIFTGDGTYIAMDAPPDREDMQPYVRIAERMLAIGLNVPRIFHRDRSQGFLLIGDLGDQSYLQVLTNANADRLYGDAISALITIQNDTDAESGFLPDYDADLLLIELELFRDWFLQQHLHLKLSKQENSLLNRIFEYLIAEALAQPRVWVHRDYHSRNLMVVEDHNPGILDFQDAVIGPITYDLVSLLRDCYIDWPQERIETWMESYRQQALTAGLPISTDRQEFRRWFDTMGVQRHLKAIGIFSRLNYRDGKSAYLGDIPRTLAYVREASAHYEKLHPLHHFLEKIRLD